MWLDDERPAPPGWVHVRSVTAAKKLLLSGAVDEASLDHDLGMCKACIKGFDGNSPHRRHRKSGYDLVLWMMDRRIWPAKVKVHSMNPVGRQNMLQVIERHKPRGEETT